MGRRKKVQVMVDENGYEVPLKHIDPDILERHEIVEKNHADILAIQQFIASRMEEVRNRTKGYLMKISEKFGEKWQGNAELYNFSQTKKTTIKIAKKLVFDEKLQIAKTKIDKCVKRWSKGSDDKIVVLINDAFKVDKKGNLDAKQILSLRNKKFNDQEWKEAMDLISEAVMVESTKEYINQYVRDEDNSFHIISIRQ